MEFWIVPSLNVDRIYFLFREDGTEIKIEVGDNKVYSYTALYDHEKQWFDKYFLGTQKTIFTNSKVVQLHKKGLTDPEIATRLNIGLNSVIQITTSYWEEKMKIK